MMMDGRMNGDRVDEVRVGHVQQVGHGVWCVLTRLKSSLNRVGSFKPKKQKNSQPAVDLRDELIGCGAVESAQQCQPTLSFRSHNEALRS